jgi:peptide chain release factor subunit 3
MLNPKTPAAVVVVFTLLQIGDVLQLMPNKMRVKVEAVYKDEMESKAALSGENLRLRLSGKSKESTI